ncbi:MAG: type II toxin-antitoxin system HipA family toxin [Hyphomicrobium sp.]|nr:type II toxin-antitoxin system HipA family toxin [Hyphomicrobium sp.]
MAELPVYYESRVVGTIEVHAEGPSFAYAPEWLSMRGAFPISLLMPLSPRRVPPRLFLPWAANLLPEATQLKAIGLQLGASPADVIGILSELGRDTAGALSIGEPGTANPDWRPVPNDKALERILAELPSKPFLVGDDGVSMSLAGVQTKLGVAIDDKGRICVPINGAPSTWILKPDSPSLYGGVQNEALCLVLARRLGLNAPEVTTGKAGKRTYLMVKRYDRVEQQGRWRRLHQEDFCQALGKPPSAKYETNQTGIPGPTLAQMFAVTRNAMQAPDVVNLLDYVIFNVLACNTDAHAKNYSLMISGKGFKLAPIYDVMCALAWEHVTRNMAQKIAGKSRGEHLKRRHWQRFAADVGLNAPRLIARVETLAKAALIETRNAAADVAAMPAGAHPLMQQVTEAIEGRARALLSGLTEDEPAGADKPAETAKARKPASKPPRKNARARTT